LEIVDAASPDLLQWHRSDGWRPSLRPDGTPGSPRLRGDVTLDDRVDGADIDALFAELGTESPRGTFDLTGDGLIRDDDVDELVVNILGTRYGDLDLDGKVDARDFKEALGNFTGPGRKAKKWSDGDLDGEADVDNSDLALLLANLTNRAAEG
jgi:hypothetical protein